MVQVDGKSLDELDAEPQAIVGGKLPAAQHFYDIPVTFMAPLETARLEDRQTHLDLPR